MNKEELKELQNKVIKKNKEMTKIFKIVMGFVLGITLVINGFIVYKIKSFAFFTLYHMLFSLFFEFVFGFCIFSLIKFFVFGSDSKIFNKNFDRIYVLESLKEVFDDLTFNSEKGISEEEVKKSGLIDTGDRFSSDDYISGNYKKIRFEQSDVHVEEEETYKDSDGNTKTRWVTTFLGRWMNFDFNKEFKTNVIIYNSSWGFNLFGKYKKVKMEDQEFNKKFTVYAELEHEAYYILTPHFMERLKNLDNRISGSITFGFVDSRLYVTINNYKNSFDHSIFEPIDEEKVKKELTGDIKLITDFVDELNLDNDLFKEMKK